MLLSKEILIKWSKVNKKEFVSKGYKFTKFGDSFLVNFSDVEEGSTYQIQVKCDYCGIVFWKQYRKFLKGRKNINKDCCEKSECRGLKSKDALKMKNGNSKGSNGYWSIKENRLKELDMYIKENGKLDNFQNDEEGSKLFLAIHNYKDDIYQMVSVLGYNMKNLRKKSVFPAKHFEDINNLKPVIEEFISEYNRFPTYTELTDKLRVPSAAIIHYGGIQKMKSMFDYDISDDFKDDSGFYNRSSYEYMVAQFLFSNKISYKREQMPFPSEGNYRSDFTIYTIDGRKIHVEVWGYSKYIEQNSSRTTEYVKNRKHKEKLYDKYNITLISIEPSLFDKNTYQGIQKELKKLFNPYFNIKLEIFDNEVIIPPNKLSDDELFESIMKYSDNEMILPSTMLLQKKNQSLYNEMRKRYGSIKTFAKKYNKLTKWEVVKEGKKLNAI